MRADVQKIFRLTPHTKQVMMFSATLNDEIRAVCKKFMHNVPSHNIFHHNLSKNAHSGRWRCDRESR